MQEALEFLKKNKDVALATVSADARPMVRAFQIMKVSGTTLYFATSSSKQVYKELQYNPAIELLALKDNISVRAGGVASFNVSDVIQQEIYNTNPVLQRLYSDYRALTFFSMDIDHMDYFDLTSTPPVFRHYDKNNSMAQ
jgi:uncharacterized pyridoxamine 5'-phosphate oxidase family protein